MTPSEKPATSAPSAIGTIVDRRTAPRGVLPRRVQMWVMVGVALALLGIIVLTGNPTPRERAEVIRSAPTPVDAQRVTGYQHQLAQRERELARELAALPPPATQAAATGNGSEPQATAPTDPLADERRRREYASLFASNVALTSRPEPSGSAPAMPAGNGGDRDLQALEARGRESLARLNASVSALERAVAPQPTPPSTAEPASSAPSLTAETSAPITTPAIRPGGDRHRVLEGTMLDTVLMTRLEGDFVGPAMCLVTTSLYSHHGDALLVPAGSRILGRVKAVDAWGQRRLAISFHRLLLPDGTTYALDNFLGLSAAGATGLADRVNRHYLSTFGAAAAIGLVSGLSQWVGAGRTAGGDGDGDRTVVVTGAGADSTAQAVAQVLNQYTNRLPTVTIREGHRVKVYLTQDLDLPAYANHRASPLSSFGGH